VRDRPLIEQPIGREPVIDVPASVLDRYNARILDPTTALVLPGQSRLRPTVYIADRMLVSGAATFTSRDTLTKIAGGMGYRLEPPLIDPETAAKRVALLREAGLGEAHPYNSISVRLIPDSADPVPPPDAWKVLQTYRREINRDRLAEQHVALDHLITLSGHTHGLPFVSRGSDSPYGGLPISTYGLPGWGGRQPVAWVGAAPHRHVDDFAGPRRPVVAILDTGVGDHDWFRNNGIVSVDPELDGVRIGLPNGGEGSGVTVDPFEGVLDPDAGHGTFIAGLVHQTCPDANILSVRVIPGDGAVPEHVLLDALTLLALRQRRAQGPNGNRDDAVDVVSLSLGYYHELVDDQSFDPLILQPLNDLAASGAIIVAAAGNDATDRPILPAAFAPGGVARSLEPDCVPVVAVGALNPDSTIALFSNAGRWIRVYRVGASVVSTFPMNLDASAQPTHRLHAFDGWRETIDPDDFSSGFGVWSGTSFSAPVFAGELAQELLDGKYGDFAPVAQDAMVDRGRAAVHTHTQMKDMGKS
jgi:hypothetical protein